MQTLSFYRSAYSVICLLSTSCFADSGALFSIEEQGGSTPLQIQLTLNVNGPISSQNYNVTGSDLNIQTTSSNHQYPYAGIKLITPGYTVLGLTPNRNGFYLFPASSSPTRIIIVPLNLPWYPSLEAFEHYNSGRTHVFAEAYFGGSFEEPNFVDTFYSETSYPSGYNMSYLNPDQAFIYGGGYGDIQGSIGAFVAKVDPITLDSSWYNQLIRTDLNGEWDYPGSMGILSNGFLYVSYGYRLAKLSPDGVVISTLELPTGESLPRDTCFNGFNATADGTIVMKSVCRAEGCQAQGPNALLTCPGSAPSVLVSVNPTTMNVIESITLSQPVGARPTITQFNGKNYVYLLEPTTAIRYEIVNGMFILDSSWNPGVITEDGQTLCTSFVVMNDWVVTQTNTLPASTALDVIAINQLDGSKVYKLQPFAGDPIPPIVQQAFAEQGPGGTQAISWAPMSVSADPETNLIFAADSLPGKIAALTISENELQIVWKEDQTTTEFTTLIGPKEKRVLVGTEIPKNQIPGDNSNDYAVWRVAATGRLLAKSPLLPAMTQGTMIQPYYDGDMFFEGELGTLIRLSPKAGQ